ncbi:MAG: hypothetical protein MK097_06935 [Dechloromonas sp.]|nr:hypothetical protein [Dechloromonas sp.]
MTGWPDWTGETAIIVGTGPSAGEAVLDAARWRARVVAVKSAWRLAPWADVLYGLDKGWWIAHHGVPKFEGLKVSPSPTACRVYGLKQVTLRPFADVLTKEIGVLGCGLRTGGGHSGFQAANLAVQFGARRLILVGFDMTLKNGEHWAPDSGVGKADEARTKSWRVAMDAAAPQFAALGVEVINAGLDSALTAYPKMPFEAALERIADAGQNSDRSDQPQFRRRSGRRRRFGSEVESSG